MIFNDFLKALGQMSDPRFRRVLFIGLGLTVALLIGVYALFLGLLNWFFPETLTLPFLGEVTWIDDLLSGASILLMMVLSIFLMVPVASAFTSLFLDDVADAVEATHFPGLSPAPRVSFAEGLRDSLNFLGVLIAANLVALVGYLFLGPLAPLGFIALNGFLLGREYFQLIALRRLGRDGAKAARRRHAVQIWAAGALMAAPLTIPIVNLLVPVLGAATFTHLFHRLEGQRAA
ncbi:MAG: EI24 domain-containing protein [Pseudomonadota bacterium]